MKLWQKIGLGILGVGLLSGAAYIGSYIREDRTLKAEGNRQIPLKISKYDSNVKHKLPSYTQEGAFRVVDDFNTEELTNLINSRPGLILFSSPMCSMCKKEKKEIDQIVAEKGAPTITPYFVEFDTDAENEAMKRSFENGGSKLIGVPVTQYIYSGKDYTALGYSKEGLGRGTLFSRINLTKRIPLEEVLYQ